MLADPLAVFMWRALAIFLLGGAFSGVLLGLLLIVNPRLLELVNRVANRWVSTRRFGRILDRSVSIERWFYRHHRATGITIMLGAAYIMIYFGALYDRVSTLRGLGGMLPVKLLEMLLDALVLGSLLGSVAAFIFGLFICFRPSLLRDMESKANLWVSMRNTTKILDVPHGQMDVFIMRHARRVGWVLLLGSIYLLVVMARFLA